MTSAFVPFHLHHHQHPQPPMTSSRSVSPPSPPLPSPPLYSSQLPAVAGATKPPVPYEPRTTTRDRRDDSAIFEKSYIDVSGSPSLALRPIRQQQKQPTSTPMLSPPSDGVSLPPLQNLISSAALSEHALLSPPEETEELASSVSSSSSEGSSRKGSIASLLNSDPELRQHAGAASPERRQQQQQQLQHHLHHHHHRQEAASSGAMSPPLTFPLKRSQEESAVQCPPKKRKCPESAALPRRPSTHARSHGDDDTTTTRANKGLRHFSKQVCDKVAEKGVTTYNEVADELALDIRASMDTEKRSFDQKNIRRRVYDALNVLMAMDIIAKDKKQIKWLGIPSYFGEQHFYRQAQMPSSETAETDRYLELQKLVNQEERRQAQLVSSMDRSRGLIRDKLVQHLQLCNLVWRNRHSHHYDAVPAKDKISLPFFIIASREEAHVQVANDGLSAEIVQASSDAMGEQMVSEDADVLRCLGLDHLSTEQLNAWIPDPSWCSFLSIGDSPYEGAVHIHARTNVFSASSS